MATIGTWLKQFFFVGFDQSGRSGRAQNGKTNCTTATVPQGTIPLTQASHAERDSYWKNQPYTTAREQLQEWERCMDTWLAGLTEDQEAFLKRLLREPDQRFDTVEVTANALYKTFFQEGQGDVEIFARRIGERNSVAQIQRELGLIENLAGMYGEQSAAQALPLLSALIETQEHHRHALVLGTDDQTGQEVVLSQKALEQHVSLVGLSGSGKTTLLLSMLNQLIRQGHGIALVEPHGDLTRHVIACLPEHRLKDVLYLDMTDAAKAPPGINLYQCDHPDDMTEVAKVAAFLMHLFERLWNLGPHTPLLAMVLRNVTRTLIESKATFAELPLLLWHETVREKLVSKVTNPQTLLFWQEYTRKSPRERSELISSTINKADAYLNEPLIANIVSQSQTTINFRHIMDEGKILLVNLSPQLEEMSRLIGSMLIGKLLMAAFSRIDTPEQHRRQFYIFIDEFQRFSSSELRTFIEEARKFKVSCTIAHQSLSQLEEEQRTATTGAGVMLVFRVSGNDSKILARSYDAMPAQELLASTADPLGHLTRNGSTHPALATFISDYLMPLEACLRIVGHALHPFEFGCTVFQAGDAIQGRALLNEVLYECMKTGRADIFVHPLALFTLGGAADTGMTHVFSDHFKHGLLSGWEFEGFSDSANRFGGPGFLANEKAVNDLLKKHAKKRVWDDAFSSRIVTPGPSFIAMLRSLRAAMEVLAKSPIMVDTAEFRTVQKPTTYADQENAIANQISQLENYHAKAKILTREHLIKTLPPPPLIPEHEVQARIVAIKERMLLTGITRPYPEVAEEIRKRHEHLRERPPSDAPPPSHTNGNRRRRNRPRPPDTHA